MSATPQPEFPIEIVDLEIEGIRARCGPDYEWHCKGPKWLEVLNLYTETTPAWCGIPGPRSWWRAKWIVDDLVAHNWNARLLTPQPEPPPDDDHDDEDTWPRLIH